MAATLSSILLTWDFPGMVHFQPHSTHHILDLCDLKNIEIEFESGFYKKTD